MTYALILTVVLVASVVVVWINAKTAGRESEALKYEKEKSKYSKASIEIASTNINMSDADLNARVREKREAAKQCMYSKD